MIVSRCVSTAISNFFSLLRIVPQITPARATMCDSDDATSEWLALIGNDWAMPRTLRPAALTHGQGIERTLELLEQRDVLDRLGQFFGFLNCNCFPDGYFHLSNAVAVPTHSNRLIRPCPHQKSHLVPESPKLLPLPIKNGEFNTAFL